MEPTREEHNKTDSSFQQLTIEEEHLLRTSPHKYGVRQKSGELKKMAKKWTTMESDKKSRELKEKAKKEALRRDNMDTHRKSRELEEQ